MSWLVDHCTPKRRQAPGRVSPSARVIGIRLPCLPPSFGQGCNMCLPTSPGRVLPLPLFLSMASKLLRDQQSLVSLLIAPMLSDVFGANVEGRVLGPCCKSRSQISISPYICILCTMNGCRSAWASFGFFLSRLVRTTWMGYNPMSLLLFLDLL